MYTKKSQTDILQDTADLYFNVELANYWGGRCGRRVRPAGPPACWPAGLPASLPACLPICLPTHLISK